jgi:hypothetical protein
MNETNERLVGVLKWHLKNPSPRRDFDNDTIDQTWSKGFDSGYESGRLSLIKELVGTVEYDRIVAKVKNE